MTQPARHLQVVQSVVDENPFGFCHCGCGQKTAISKLTRRGVKAGEPVKYIRGHRAKVGCPPEYILEDRGYETPCWVWQRRTNNTGYGQSYANGRGRLAHSIYYEREHGPVPEGLELDHLCRVRACVNPAHLEAVTHAENMLRSPQTKVSLEARAAIAASTDPAPVLAARYGVSLPTIWHYRRVA